MFKSHRVSFSQAGMCCFSPPVEHLNTCKVQLSFLPITFLVFFLFGILSASSSIYVLHVQTVSFLLSTISNASYSEFFRRFVSAPSFTRVKIMHPTEHLAPFSTITQQCTQTSFNLLSRQLLEFFLFFLWLLSFWNSPHHSEGTTSL